MAEWYGKATAEGDTEHARLSRILDVAQELKALSVLLQTNLFPFVIDLAVLASRREYLNLDKWLSDQLQVNNFIICSMYLVLFELRVVEVRSAKIFLINLCLKRNDRD